MSAGRKSHFLKPVGFSDNVPFKSKTLHGYTTCEGNHGRYEVMYCSNFFATIFFVSFIFMSIFWLLDSTSEMVGGGD